MLAHLLFLKLILFHKDHRSYQEIESAFMNLAQKHAIAGGTDEETSY